MAWSDVLQAVLVLPFTAGNSRTLWNRPVHLDGTTSTVVIKIFYVSLILLLVKTMMDQGVTLISFVGVQCLFSIVVSLGLLSCLAVVIVIKVKGFHSIMERRPDVMSANFQKLVLWVFGILSVMFCFLKSGHIIECINTPNPQYTGHAQVMDCVYYITVLVFLSVQMLSLTYLTPYRFKMCSRIQYMILLVLASNLTVMVYGLMDHDQLKSQGSHGNVTWSTNCSHQTFTHMLQVSDKILHPIFLEYSMLAITMTQNVSVQWETYNNGVENEVRDIHVMTETSESTFDENSESGYSNVCINAETPLLSGVSTESVQSKQKPSFLFYVILMLSALISVSIFIGYIVRVTGHSQMPHEWIPSLELVISVMMAVCTFTGYYLVARDTHPPFKSDPISGGEYVFIISSIGSLLENIFRVMTSLKTKTPNYVIAASRGIFGTLSYLQTVFILHASRCSPKHHGRNKASLRGTLLLLSLYNCGCWIIESFIVGGFPEVYTEDKQILGSELWEISQQICHPMHVFFRFASALELYKLYKKFRT